MVLNINVCVVILVYNYLSGVLELSMVDCSIIKELVDVLKLVGVCIFDYIVVGVGFCVSMVEWGFF